MQTISERSVFVANEKPYTDDALNFNLEGVSEKILSILTKVGYTVPTPIQAKAIPVATSGRDVIGIAQTGTGKTLAFTVPILERLLQNNNETALVIVPTRELAQQVMESIRKVAIFLNPPMRTVCLIGGVPIYRQIRDLKGNPRIVIATPGRLQDHLNQKTIRLDKVGVLVLDEADRMLDMGFAPQINSIMVSIPQEHQTMLFSATMPKEIAGLVNKYMVKPERVEVENSVATAQLIKQELCYVEQTEKPELLKKLLHRHEGPVLVFTRTKFGASKLAKHVQILGHTSTDIHSNKSMSQRKMALEGFKAGRYRILVATDVAARGIDVQNIELVVNYDLPDAIEDYVHRIGRTGRAGKDGQAISFATRGQFRDVKSIEKIINKALPLSDLSCPAPAGGGFSSSSSSSYRGGSSRGGFGGNGGGGSRGGFSSNRGGSSSSFSGGSRGGSSSFNRGVGSSTSSFNRGGGASRRAGGR